MNLLLKQLKLENVADAIKVVNSAKLVYPHPLSFNFFTFFRHVKAYNISFEHSFIAYQAGQPIGTVLNCSNAKEKELYTYVWAITPEIAGTRMAADFTRFAMDHIKKHGFNHISCEVIRESDQAFWLKLGFHKKRELHSFRTESFSGAKTELTLSPCQMQDIDPLFCQFHTSQPPWVKRPAQLHSYQDELKKFLLLQEAKIVGYLLLSETENMLVITDLGYEKGRPELGRAALEQAVQLLPRKPLFSFYIPTDDELFDFYKSCGFETFLVHNELEFNFTSNN